MISTHQLIGSYDHLQVALSVLIAISASYAALDLAARLTAARSSRARLAWFSGGAIAMGIGIWAMHFVGMLAFSLPILVKYHWPTVVISLLVAILASALALAVVSRKRLSMRRELASGVVMGAGIASMHYIGMAAVRLAAEIQFNLFVVALSVVLAMTFSLSALWLSFHFRGDPKKVIWQKLGSAAIMGGAVAGMHYTGMAAARFIPSNIRPDLAHAVGISALGTVAIGSVTLLLLALAVLACSVDRWFAAQALEVERAQARMELTRAARIATMGELTASIAHEINQPLAAVATYVDACSRWLAVQPPNVKEAQETLTKAAHQANRASEVIHRVRGLLGKSSFQMARVDVNEMIYQALDLTSHELIKGGVTVTTELADVSPVYGDRVQLQQVLLNLIMNAIEAMSSATDQPRELRIRSRMDAEEVLIQIEDSGTGLDPEKAVRIFEPFFTTKPHGIGMGLAISRSIVEAHGGRLWATSLDSLGAVFQFTLRKEGAAA